MTIEKFELVGVRPTILKDPDAILDYTIDFSGWLSSIEGSSGDYIINATVLTSGGVVVESVQTSPTYVVAWLSGGTAGVMASATYRITTAQGRTDDRTVYFRVIER